MIGRSLTGRLLLLTAAFVALAEVLVLLPSIARTYEEFLRSRLERAQIAALALLASDGSISEPLAEELLFSAGVYNVVLRRDAVRELVLSSPVPGPVRVTFDLRAPTPWHVMRDAITAAFLPNSPEAAVVRVFGAPVREAGLFIEISLDGVQLRNELRRHAARILAVSLGLTLAMAALLVLFVQRLIVQPIRRVIQSMAEYAQAPEDARRILQPSAQVTELRQAEEALARLQRDLAQALRQRERLAQLGGSVARINHDLRNILTTATMIADRIESSSDPAVQRAAPKLVAALARAARLCEATLTYGKAAEPAPKLEPVALRDLVEETIEAERLAAPDAGVDYLVDMPSRLMVLADREHLLRILSNLVRNARQAIEGTRRAGAVEIAAAAHGSEVIIRIIDTGPGLPAKAQEKLFQAFQGGARTGGVGLGLAIAQELARAQGGRLELARTGPEGTEFQLFLPAAATKDDARGSPQARSLGHPPLHASDSEAKSELTAHP